MDEILIKKITRTDIKEILDFYNSERGKSFTYQYFMQKYSTDWVQKELLGFACYSGNKIIGFRGTTLYKFGKYTFAQCGDAIMAKDYRGKGYFSKMLSELQNEAFNCKVDGIFVTPNEQAELVYEHKQGWKKIGDFYVFDFVVKTYPLLKIFNYFNYHWHYFSVLETKINDKILSRLTNPDVKSGKICVKIDVDYLQYKTYGHYSCLKYGDKVLLWSLSDGMMIIYSEVQTMYELQQEIAFLHKYCKKRGIHKFSYSCYSNSALYELLKSKYVGKEEIPVYYYPINSEIEISKLLFHRIDKNAFDV
ncbi:MAG: GNAT family N-acetyltransferase [Bacteroidales bacterium]|nr:GNAT family N-acetyltransferase [Bacteroidales bacterium]